MNSLALPIQETCFFAPITRKASKVAIIANGPSFRGINFALLASDVHVIAVKGAIDGLRRVDSWITVDANRRTRTGWMATSRRRSGVDYYAAVPADYGQPNARLLWHRAKAEEDVHFLLRIPGIGLSEDPSVLHTGNSAFAALGLAYHMRASKIALFGVDGTQEQYGLGLGRPRGDLSHLPALFASANTQIAQAGAEVRSAGRLKCYPQEDPIEVIQWLNAA